MKKRVLAGLLMSVMVLASAMSAFAAPSTQDFVEVVVPESSAQGDYKEGDYVITDNGKEFDDLSSEAGLQENFGHIEKAKGEKLTAEKKEEIKENYKVAVEIIKKVDEGKQVGTDVKIDNGKIDKELKDKKVVKSFFDVHATGDKKNICYEEGKTHVLTIKVPSMTKAWKNIVILHYSTIRCEWEIIVPKVDYDKKTLTFEVQDLSPIAIYADIEEAADNATGKSPSTGSASSAWMICSAMALIVLGTGVVASQKKRG